MENCIAKPYVVGCNCPHSSRFGCGSSVRHQPAVRGTATATLHDHRERTPTAWDPSPSDISAPRAPSDPALSREDDSARGNRNEPAPDGAQGRIALVTPLSIDFYAVFAAKSRGCNTYVWRISADAMPLGSPAEKWVTHMRPHPRGSGEQPSPRCPRWEQIAHQDVPQCSKAQPGMPGGARNGWIPDRPLLGSGSGELPFRWLQHSTVRPLDFGRSGKSRKQTLAHSLISYRRVRPRALTGG